MSSLPSVQRGAFVLFEGIDRCGKTTQTQLLFNALKSSSIDSKLIRFPNRTSTIGGLINSYLSSSAEINDNTIHLLFSANRWESQPEIERDLLSGCTLICDRYAFSGVAFSSAKGMDLDWCKSCDKGLPAPDCIIYLDMPVEESATRGNFGDERYEKIDFQEKVQRQFASLRAEDEVAGGVPWKVVDARKPIEEIHQEILQFARNTIREISERPIQRLWTK